MTLCLPLFQIAACNAVDKMLEQWNSTVLPVVGEHSEPEHVLAYSECLHAQIEMECKDIAIAAMTSNLKEALAICELDNTLRFDASRFTGDIEDLPRASYCRYDCTRTRSAIDARVRA